MGENEFLVVTNLSESDAKVRWVHALSYGKFKHPVFGEKLIDINKVTRLHKNIQAGVRGIEPYINYDHREHTGEAAGWIKDSNIRDNGLWVKIEFTDDAVEKIRKKGYKYFSSEFTDKYTDPKTGEEYQDVLIGGALTNVPFLKDLEPLTLSEITKENSMDREALLKLLGLEPDASDDDIKAKVTSLTESKDEDEPTLDDLEIQIGDPDEDGKATITVKRGDATKEFQVEAPKVDAPANENKDEDELAALAENHPEVAQLMERVGHLETAQRLSETETTLDKVGKESKKALSPVVKKKLAGLMVQLSESVTKDLAEALNLIATGEGVVDLSEKGEQRTEDDVVDPDNVVTEFMEVVHKVREDDKEGKLTYADAIAAAGKREPELYAQYREATTRNAATRS